MTIQEAIDKIDTVLNSTVYNDESLEYEISSYDFDWLEIAKSALEKQIPKKPIEKEVIGASMSGYKYKGNCLKCLLTVRGIQGNYCPNCGQAIDWRENNG